MGKSLSVFLICITLFVSAQNTGPKGSVKGFVYDKANGEGIPFATIKADGTDFGAVTDEQGFFSIPNLPLGNYKINCSYVGYQTQTQEVEVKKGQTVNLKIFLSTKSMDLKDVEINAEQQKKVTETRVSVTTITPIEMKRIPTIGGEADIAQYLQILPGVISTGDQGGQIVIRGGTPIQTSFLLDGIQIFNPFHSIGLFSVYETDIIKNIDVYTGGFPAQYGTRTSAVIDVTTRDGNRKEFSGKVSASPFMAHALLEIPIVKLQEDKNTNATLILNTKVSYLDQSSKALYSYADKNGLPYSFYDVYGKFSLSTGSNKLNLTGFNYHDNANFAAARYGWNTFGVGGNFLAVPKNSNISFNTHVSYSQYKISLTEADGLPRSSSIGAFNIGMDFNYYINQGELKYGLDVEGTKTDFAFTNSYLQNIAQNQNSTDLGAYLMVHKYIKRFVVEAGARFQYYGNIGAASPEPRLSIKVNATDYLRFKLASGLYSQNLISTKSNQDVVDLFTGFITGPQGTPTDASGKTYDKVKNMQRSVHAIFGIELDPVKNLSFNIEPYYKYFFHVFDINQYKQQTSDPDYLISQGNAYGLDILGKYQYKGLFLYATYSLSYSTRNDGVQTYPPYFDRRHNVNVIAAYSFGKNRSWEVSARWNLGSGFPFTQTQAFYESNPFTNGIGTNITANNGTLQAVYATKIDGGRLPFYHRLDLQIKKVFTFKERFKLELNASVSNVYDRKNIFYFDRVSYTRVNQLPILPSLSVAFAF